jgi:hypothetical protein
VNSAEFHQVNASCKFRVKCLQQLAECLEQLIESMRLRLNPCVFGRVPGCSAESLGVQLSPWMACRVPGWPVDSFLGGNSYQHEGVSVFNPRDSEVPLPPG